MSVLGSKDVIERIKQGNLVISPLFSDQQIGHISIDLRMGNTAMIVKGTGLSHVDPMECLTETGIDEHRKEQGKRQKYKRHEIPFGTPLLLHPGSLTLVPTLEWVKLPNDLKGVVTARSTWAREGLNIATANFIDPLYNGIITLELANFGQIPIALYPGMRIAQIAFYEVSGEAFKDDKKNQFNMSFEPQPGDIIKHDSVFFEK